MLRRRLGVRDAYRLAAVGVVAVLLAAGVWQIVTAQRGQAHDGLLGRPDHPGARALVDGAPPPAPLLPAPVSVYDDWVRFDDWACGPLPQAPAEACTQPVPSPPERRIVVVGDSHMQQLTAALIPIAQQHGWQLITMLRGGCPFSTVSEAAPDDAECLAWNSAAFEAITQLRPDAVVTLATRDVRPGPTEQTPSGFVEQWWRLKDLGIRVLAIRDNPRFDFSVPDCVQQNGGDACGVARAAVYAPVPPYAGLAVPPNVTFLDLADVLCDHDRCPAQIGNVLVYMDDNHLSAAYATTMASLVEERVLAALG